MDNKMESIKMLESIREDDNYSAVMIDKVIDLIEQLKPTPKAFPTNRNSVQLKWEKDMLLIELEVYEDKIEVFGYEMHEGTIVGE